jgi:hypothetical protein
VSFQSLLHRGLFCGGDKEIMASNSEKTQVSVVLGSLNRKRFLKAAIQYRLHTRSLWWMVAPPMVR